MPKKRPSAAELPPADEDHADDYDEAAGEDSVAPKEKKANTANGKANDDTTTKAKETKDKPPPQMTPGFSSRKTRCAT